MKTSDKLPLPKKQIYHPTTQRGRNIVAFLRECQPDVFPLMVDGHIIAESMSMSEAAKKMGVGLAQGKFRGHNDQYQIRSKEDPNVCEKVFNDCCRAEAFQRALEPTDNLKILVANDMWGKGVFFVCKNPNPDGDNIGLQQCEGVFVTKKIMQDFNKLEAKMLKTTVCKS